MTVVSAVAGASGAPPKASIAPIAGGDGRVNSGDVARLRSVVATEAEASVAFAWSCVRVPAAGGDEEAVDLTADGFVNSESLTSANLAIAPDRLELGYLYTVRLDVSDANGDAAAFATLSANGAPTGGAATATPSAGTALSTIFTVSAGAWADADAPLAYRFTYRVVGEDDPSGPPQQLQDFSPLAEYVGVLPGGSATHENVVTVGAQARDALGATSEVVETNVTVTWPSIATEAAATEATSSAVRAAEEALRSGGAEAAINQVAGACRQLAAFKANVTAAARKRRSLLTSSRSLLEAFPAEEFESAASRCLGGGGVEPTGAAATRAAEREAMLSVTSSASAAVPSSVTLFGSVADVVSRVLDDPCEASSAARLAGVAAVADMLDAVASDAEGDLSAALSETATSNMLSALSASTRKAAASDANAKTAEASATASARALAKAAVASALPGERPASGNATRMAFVASRSDPLSLPSAARSAAGGAAFDVPREALELGAGAPVDRLLLALAFDAHADDATNVTAAPGDVASAPRVAGTLALTFEVAGASLAVHNLTRPIAFEIPIRDVDAVGFGATCAESDFRRASDADSVDDSDSNATRPAATCAFWDEAAAAYSSEGCATLPNPFPPGGSLAWRPEALAGSAALASANASFLWTFDHPTLLAGCELLTDLVSADGTTRMRGYATANGSSVECLMESAENAARCRWRRDAQAFEGCGCETASRVACLCDHATDFTASASPPRVRPISVAELASVSLEDLMNTWKVFAVVFGMFASMMALAAAFQTRDRRAKRKLLNKFIDGDRATRMGFHAVADVWTWCIDVQEMQFMFNNLHHANPPEVVLELLREELAEEDPDADGPDDAALETRRKEIFDMVQDFAAPEVHRAVRRRRMAMERAARATKGLPQVKTSSAAPPPLADSEKAPGRPAGDDDDETDAASNAYAERVDPEVVRRVESEIEREVEKASVGIDVRVVDGKTRFSMSAGENAGKPGTLNAGKLGGLSLEKDPGSEDDGSPSPTPPATDDERKDDASRRSDGSRSGSGSDARSTRRKPDSEETLARQKSSESHLLGRVYSAIGGSLTLRRSKKPNNRPFEEVEALPPKSRRKYLRSLTRRPTEYVPPPRDAELDAMPTVSRNGPTFCSAVGLRYVRFMIAFPIESLNRNLILWKNADDRRGAFIPFDRAVGTALVYAFLDVKCVVSHVEMASRIYDAAQLPFLMPTGVTFPLLVAEFKAMISGNISKPGWQKRSVLWNIIALQNPDGHWNASDSLAGALRATGPRTLGPPILHKVNEHLTVKSFYVAEAMLEACPSALRDLAPRLGHRAVDSMWCTLLALEGCAQAGMSWVLNPWDDRFFEYDILQCGWTWLEQKIDGDAQYAAAVVDAMADAERCVTAWRERFVEEVKKLHAMRMREKKKRALQKATTSDGFARRFGAACAAFVAAPVSETKRGVKYCFKVIRWMLSLYFAAHIFLRAFLARATDAFSGAERVVMQSTGYLVTLIVATWFYYVKALECCVILRRDVGCSDVVTDACAYVPEGAGCSVLMAQGDLRPEGWRCGAFPDSENGWHFLTVLSIQIVIMFPVKFTLTTLFTTGGAAVLEPHWRQALVAAGMSMMEVYVAWLEGLYQAILDPLGVFDRPEIKIIIKKFKRAMKKFIMVVLMSQAMLGLGSASYLLERAGLKKKKKIRERRFQDVDDIQENIRAVAMKDATFALKVEEDEETRRLADLETLEDDDKVPAHVAARGVEARRLFTKGTATGALAAVDLADVEIDAEAEPVAVAPLVAAPKKRRPDLIHMRSAFRRSTRGGGEGAAAGDERASSVDERASSGDERASGSESPTSTLPPRADAASRESSAPRETSSGASTDPSERGSSEERERPDENSEEEEERAPDELDDLLDDDADAIPDADPSFGAERMRAGDGEGARAEIAAVVDALVTAAVGDASDAAAADDKEDGGGSNTPEHPSGARVVRASSTALDGSSGPSTLDATIRDAVAAARELAAELAAIRVVAGDASSAAYATELATRLAAAMDDTARAAEADEDALRAFALLRAAVFEEGGVKALVAALDAATRLGAAAALKDAAAEAAAKAAAEVSLPASASAAEVDAADMEKRVSAALARRRAEEARAACSALRDASAALLARVCVDNPPALLEFRVENGYDVVARFLRGDGGSAPSESDPDVPGVSKRAEADALAVVASGARESSRAARRAVEAGLVQWTTRRIHQLSLAHLDARVSEERVSEETPNPSESATSARVGPRTPSPLTDPFLRDREVRDRLAAVASAFSVLKRAERARERDAARALTRTDLGEFFVDVTRLLPPNISHPCLTSPVVAEAFAAMLAAYPGAVREAERALRRAATLAEAGVGASPLGAPGFAARETLRDAFADVDPMIPTRLLADRENRGDAKHGHLLPRTRTAKEAANARWLGAKALGLAALEKTKRASERGGDGGAAVDDDDGELARKESLMDKSRYAAADLAEAAMEAVETNARDLKAKIAVKNISFAEVERRRKIYVKKLRWSSLVMDKAAWILAAFVWGFGGYVVLVYGVLIYRYLGPGEEDAYISQWGMAFLISTFGVESIFIVGRKTIFIFIITKLRRKFMKAAEALGWYETYTEMVGMHLLMESGEYGDETFKADEDVDGGDGEDGEDGDDGGD